MGTSGLPSKPRSYSRTNDVTEDLLEKTLLLLPSLMLEDKGCGGSQRLFGLIAIEVWSVKVKEGNWSVLE
jgi:hypothetical protein